LAQREAPKKAEELFKKAKEAQDKMAASEKTAATHLAKSQEAEKAADILSAKALEERKKTEEIEKENRKVLRSIDETKKEIEETKKEVSNLQKKTEQDKTDMDNKAKEVKSLLKKLDDALKGARFDLKSKQPQVRIKTANGLAKLPAFPEARLILAEALVEAMLDPLPEVRNAASEALAIIDPAIQPYVLTLTIGNNKRGAGKALEQLGTKAKYALPAVIHCYRQAGPGDDLKPDQYPIVRAIWLDSLARIAPNDKRVVQIVLNEVTNSTDRFHFARQKALELLDTVEVDKKDKVQALLTVLDDRVLAVQAITAIGTIGPPEADVAVPALRRLKSSPNDAVRQEATKVLLKIEKSK
jgi:hypothetical protein